MRNYFRAGIPDRGNGSLSYSQDVLIKYKREFTSVGKYEDVRWNMKNWCRSVAVVLLFCILEEIAFPMNAGAAGGAVQMVPALVEMKEKEEGPENLYALSAVLMDGDSGRILYEKEGYKPRANASTTKVMTCILALEKGAGDDYVQVSAKAAAQPEVKLGLKEGEQYYLEDLLYSLMLKSHNDTAVAIAEHIGGSVEGFADMMNEKAKELGCTNTHFVTPNGLDSADKEGVHETTARDLALIMRYAIKNKTFLYITRTRDYSFSDLSGNRQFSVHNTNAFLDMTPDAVSGKTGFTGDAGYCYVAACENGGRTFIISLLGCGWPNNKTYKWKDAMKLLEYGKKNYHYEIYWQNPGISPILVKDGVPEGEESQREIYVKGLIQARPEEMQRKVLLKEGEKVTYHVQMKKTLTAPVKKNEQIGKITFSLGEWVLDEFPIVSNRDIVKITYNWCVDKVFHDFFH